MSAIKKNGYRARVTIYSTILVFAINGCGDATIGDVTDSGADGPGCTPVQTWYLDSDNDGFGDPQQSVQACESVFGHVSNDGDCDDSDMAVKPGQEEICGDGVDNDCIGGDACRASLVAHWRFDDAQGSNATDSSGNGHTGVLNGSPTWEGDKYLSFDGIDDYVEVPHTSSLLLDEGTVALWFFTGDAQRAQGILSKDSSGYDTGGHLTISLDYDEVEKTNQLTVRLQDLNRDYYLTKNDIAQNTWYHVVVLFGSVGLKLHVDKTLEEATTYTGGLGMSVGDEGNLEPIVIGSNSQVSENQSATPVTEPFVGTIHDVRLYDRALIPAEIDQLYDETTP